MSFQNCPRCGLAIRGYPERFAPQHCPRCIARDGTAVPMYSSPHPVRLATHDSNVSEIGLRQGRRGVPPTPDAGTAA